MKLLGMTPTIASYLDWQPVISAEEVFQQTIGFSYLSVDEIGNLFWVESRPEEEGRSVLVMRDLAGKTRDVFGREFSTRSRVFEYGSTPYMASRGTAYFVNVKDQRLYKSNYSSGGSTAATAITTEKTTDNALAKYADLVISPDGRWLIFAYEKEYSDREAVNEIGVLDLKISEPQEARTVCGGADFYKTPRFSPDGKKLAWLEWNHPYMPWDSTLLFEADFDLKTGTTSAQRHIAGSESSSISCIDYSSAGDLIFSVDYAGHSDEEPHNFYNLYRYHQAETAALTTMFWDFTSFRCHQGKVFALAFENGLPGLLTVDLESGEVAEVPLELANFSAPVLFSDKMYLAGKTSTAPVALMEVSHEGQVAVLRKSTELTLDKENISVAVPVSFPTEDGEISHGYFYQPVNKNFTAPVGEKPPVRVLIHGGPTHMTYPGFSKELLFWTSQGYAVFDVNYRGSLGFGRKYRDALLQKWGVLEIQDVKDGLAALREEGMISEKAVVSGGSAGGYTVQRLLTFYPDLFAVGASHFGIGNLVTLQRLTHKFESRYLQQLIGGTLENNLKEYEERSPIHHLSQLKSPMIIFQGSEDKVVPPENSREMAAVLKEKGIRHEYYEYPGEAHGFRRKENLVHSLKQEAAFFKAILSG